MAKDKTFDYVLEGCQSGSVLVVAACLVEAGAKKNELLCQQHSTSDGMYLLMYRHCSLYTGVLLRYIS